MITLKESIITIKIKGSGEETIFFNAGGCAFKKFDPPSEIYINNNKQNKGIYSFNFGNTINNIVKLKWNTPIYSTFCMFSWISSIIEVDLSHFDSSQVTSMDLMFQDCSSLTSIKLSNLDTTRVKTIGNLFKGCSSLTFLD